MKRKKRNGGLLLYKKIFTKEIRTIKKDSHLTTTTTKSCKMQQTKGISSIFISVHYKYIPLCTIHSRITEKKKVKEFKVFSIKSSSVAHSNQNPYIHYLSFPSKKRRKIFRQIAYIQKKRDKEHPVFVK